MLHGKKALLLALMAGLAGLPVQGAEEEPKPLNLHEKASACFDNQKTVFATPPFTCEETCGTCHLSENILPLAGQPRVDEVFPYLFPETTGTYDERWLELPPEHQSCQNCHEGHSEEEGNHPIFVQMDPFFEEEEEETRVSVYEGEVRCATCHNPHRGEVPQLLRVTNAQSALCQECHHK